MLAVAIARTVVRGLAVTVAEYGIAAAVGVVVTASPAGGKEIEGTGRFSGGTHGVRTMSDATVKGTERTAVRFTADAACCRGKYIRCTTQAVMHSQEPTNVSGQTAPCTA